MCNKIKRICRLCLADTSDNFVVIEETIKEKFDFLLLKMNLFISEEPVMCKNCSEGVETYFGFKSTCICAEDSIFPFISDNVGGKVDMAGVQFSTSENVVAEDCNICRFCVKRIKKIDCMMLDELKETKVLIENMYAKCIPEMDLKFINNPVICTTCMGNLESYFSFLTNCLDVEEKVHEYIRIEGTNSKGHVALSSVVQFSFRDLSQPKTEPSQTEEEMELSNFDNGEDEDVEVKRESYVKLEEQELIIKHEEVKDIAKNGRNSFEVEVPSLRQNINSKLDFIYDSETKIYKCEMCKFQTKLKGSLNWHKLLHKGPSGTAVYVCHLCEFKTKYMGSLKNHMLRHRQPSEITMYKCKTCDYQTKHKSSLQSHTLFHKKPSEITILKCQLCAFRTKYKWSLQSHMLIHKQPSEIAMYNCLMCAFQTKHKVSLKKHILIHKEPSETASYKCELCAFQTIHQRSLQRHILNHKKPSEITMYKCESCAYQTKHKNCIQTHMLIHKNPSEITTHKCQLCPFETKYKYSLQSHMLIHKEPSEIAMYKCQLCAFQTKRKKGLQKHTLNHKEPSEITMYKCEVCAFQTKHKGSLQRHMLNHKEVIVQK